MPRTLYGAFAASSLLLTAFAAGAHADTTKPVFRDGLPAAYAKRIDKLKSGFLSIDGSDAAKGVYDTAELWGPEVSKLRVCFFEGSKETRAKIAEIASVWMDNNMGITLDFGKKSNPRVCDPNSGHPNDVRVGFRQPGYWSLVGKGSLVYAKQDEQSMNFEDFDKIPADQLETAEDGYIKGTIIHEFGHAVGFQHEHQSPAGNCDAEYNWPHIYEYMAGPPNNWPKEQVDFNMRMATQSTLMMTDFDPNSVMLYVFPADFYLNGEQSHCYHAAPNNQMSSADRVTVDYMYPADQQERRKHYAQNRAAFQAILDKAKTSDATKGVMPDYMNIFFGAAK
jgi:astacin (peptidase family M12A)